MSEFRAWTATRLPGSFARNPPVPKILLIAVTGHGTEDDRERSREAGFDHHLVKPIDLRNMITLLTRSRLPAPESWARDSYMIVTSWTCPRSGSPHCDRPADGGRQRGVLPLIDAPEDLVELEVVDPVVLAEVHLARPLRPIGRGCVHGVQIDPGGPML